MVTFCLSACGPTAGDKRLTVRKGFTTSQVITAFEKRYRVPKLDLPKGSVQIEGKKDVAYASITQALAVAEEDDTIILAPGLYEEPIVITGKKVHLRGAGQDQTIVLARETALYVNQAETTISGIGFWSLTVGNDVSVIALSQSTVEVSDCRISGGTGPGVIVAGKTSQIQLIGNLVAGNGGGGLRIQGGASRLKRNVIARNAVAGIVLAPSNPGAIRNLFLWHDTVLDNWGGRRCVSFAHSGVVPLTPLDRYFIEASIVNTGGLGETFSESFFGKIKSTGRNFLSPSALPATDFFIEAENDDYRPRARIVSDEIGIELGALPSSEGLLEVRKTLNNAIISEKLQVAYVTSLFLPWNQRVEAHEKIKQVLYNWVAEYLSNQRLGVRLMSALGLARIAPLHWRLEVILERFLTGFVNRYTFPLKPLNFFPDNPELGKKITTCLEGKASFFPRFVTNTKTDTGQAYVLSGRVKKPFKSSMTKEPFKQLRTISNPYFDKIANALRKGGPIGNPALWSRNRMWLSHANQI